MLLCSSDFSQRVNVTFFLDIRLELRRGTQKVDPFSSNIYPPFSTSIRHKLAVKLFATRVLHTEIISARKSNHQAKT